MSEAYRDAEVDEFNRMFYACQGDTTCEAKVRSKVAAANASRQSPAPETRERGISAAEQEKRREEFLAQQRREYEARIQEQLEEQRRIDGGARADDRAADIQRQVREDSGMTERQIRALEKAEATEAKRIAKLEERAQELREKANKEYDEYRWANVRNKSDEYSDYLRADARADAAERKLGKTPDGVYARTEDDPYRDSFPGRQLRIGSKKESPPQQVAEAESSGGGMIENGGRRYQSGDPEGSGRYTPPPPPKDDYVTRKDYDYRPPMGTSQPPGSSSSGYDYSYSGGSGYRDPDHGSKSPRTQEPPRYAEAPREAPAPRPKPANETQEESTRKLNEEQLARARGESSGYGGGGSSEGYGAGAPEAIPNAVNDNEMVRLLIERLPEAA